MPEFTQRQFFGSVVFAHAEAVTVVVFPPVSGVPARHRLSLMSVPLR
jgi:hypothetical protein